MENASKFDFNLLFKEIIVNRIFVVVAFALITILLISLGSKWPKQFSSYTTIFVEEENILGPLMAGAAVQTVVIDRAAIAREIIFGRSIMYELIKQEELVDEDTTPAEQERVVNNIKGRLNISNVRHNLIKIEFKDSDADRVFNITNTIAKLFIEESLADKAHQSTEAFEFIDKQASEYKDKLQHAELELKIFRTENIDAQPGMSQGIGRRSGELQTRKEQIIQELNEAKIRKASLQKQLSGEAQASTAFSRTEQYKTRIAELQTQLDTLRMSYHESYPDIIHVKEQINDLREAVKLTDEQVASGVYDSNVDERVHSNPVYQQLQRDLYDTNTNIETLNARLEHTESSILKQLERARKVSEFDAKLQELTRDYDVNNESYSDLMRRREQARVSMNLDIEQKGLSLRIDEPAFKPHSPSGIRFLHFLLAGPIIGLLIPVGLIFLNLQINQKVRSGVVMMNTTGIPLLGETPHMSIPREVKKETISLVLISIVFLGTLAFVLVMGVMRLQGNV
ncbi:MAG: hypothetical protein OQK98_06075 [Gammaproteobacteria bacterium]|nr:hypothetical protein [Gammaproteobacteria bacterium]